MMGFGFCCCDKDCSVLDETNDITQTAFEAHYELTEGVVPVWNDAQSVATFTQDCTFTIKRPSSLFVRDNVSLFVPVGDEYYSRVQYNFDFEGTVISYIWDFGKVDEYGRDDENGTFACTRFRLLVSSATEYDTDANPCDGIPPYDTAYLIRRDGVLNCYVGDNLIDRRNAPNTLNDDLKCEITFTINGTNYTLSNSTNDVVHGFATLKRPDKFWLFPENLPSSQLPAAFPSNYQPGDTLARPSNYDELSFEEQDKWDAVIVGEAEREGCPYPAEEFDYIKEIRLPYSIPLTLRLSGFSDSRTEEINGNYKTLKILNFSSINGTSKRLKRNTVSTVSTFDAKYWGVYKSYSKEGQKQTSKVITNTEHLEQTVAPGVEFSEPETSTTTEYYDHGFFFNRSSEALIPESQVSEILETNSFDNIQIEMYKEDENVIIKASKNIEYSNSNSIIMHWKGTVSLVDGRIQWRNLVGIELYLDPDFVPAGGWPASVADSKITIEYDGGTDTEYGPDSVTIRLLQYGYLNAPDSDYYAQDVRVWTERATWGDPSTFVRQDLTFPGKWLLNATRYQYWNKEYTFYYISSAYKSYLTRKTWVDLNVVLDRYYVDPEDNANWTTEQFYACQEPSGYTNLAAISQDGVSIPARKLTFAAATITKSDITVNHSVWYTEAHIYGDAYYKNGYSTNNDDSYSVPTQTLPFNYGALPELSFSPGFCFRNYTYNSTYTSNYVQTDYDNPGEWYTNIQEATSVEKNRSTDVAYPNTVSIESIQL